ncbi:MAG TPA: methyltransferase domain-containing protein [Nitrospiria bacterium]|nr:methyltransferase domain-containing protein [Nitrospiria bacterium]
MEAINPENIIQGQRKDWNRVSSAWEKWDARIERGFGPANQFLIDKAEVREGHRVLDIGSGTGYPAIPAAELAGDSGEVIGIDIAEDMLEVARRKAGAKNLSNISFKAEGCEKLSFDDASFDAVTTRYCLMFLPHVDATLSEMLRVLKPGGRAAGLVWAAPERNPFITLATGVLKGFIDIPAPDPALPGIFALAKPGDLQSRMASAGFENVMEEEVRIEGIFSSAAEYLECLKEIAAPLQALFGKLSPDQVPEADKAIITAVEKFSSDGEIRIPGVAIGVSGSRPV